MERKFARIYRWLERCAKACSAGSWGSALADMECAKAELEEVRDEIWSQAENAMAPKPAGRGGTVLRVAFVCSILIFASAAPLAMQSQGPVVQSVAAGPGLDAMAENRLEWVTADEKALLDALRKSLSDANLEWMAKKFDGTDAAKPADARQPQGGVRRRPVKGRRRPPMSRVSAVAAPETAGSTRSSPRQIGRKALGEESPISSKVTPLDCVLVGVLLVCTIAFELFCHNESTCFLEGESV